MGVWTWLRRGDGDDLEEIHTHRAWHALHVALTGCEQGGEPPASWVVWTSPGAVEATMTSATFLHPTEVVREVAQWLANVDLERAVGDLYAAIELGTYVYSFERWHGELDMVQSGALRDAFERVRRFYADASSAGQSVAIRRG